MRAPTWLCGRLGTMTAATERLVVAGVPEEPLVALVGHDVINDRGRDDASQEETQDAEGMGREEGEAIPAPSSIVAALGRGATMLVFASALLALVSSTAAAVREQSAAARVRTGTRRARRQVRTDPPNAKRPRNTIPSGRVTWPRSSGG